MPNLVHGQDPGGALRPIQVDDNGNLSVDLVSGITVSSTVSAITNTVTVDQLSGSSWSTAIATQPITLVVDQLSGSSWSIATGSSLEVKQVSGSSNSVNIASSDITLGVNQVSGSSWSVAIESQPITLDVRQVSGSSNSVNVLGTAIVDGSGVTQPVSVAATLGVNQVSGSAWSASVNGDVAHDSPDSGGGGPVKVGGVARTTNPTAVADADRVNATFDDLGRQVITPYQIRDLVVTAYVTTTTGIETALLAGAASTFHDLVHIVAANTSDAIVDVDFRCGTAGTVIASLTIPADATAGFVPVVPIPMPEVAQAWTVDVAGSDISNTSVNFTALFVKNV